MKNNKTYVIAQDAIYRHRIGGVFDTQEKAIDAAIEMVRKENDHYHDVVVLEYELNQAVHDGKLICTAQGERDSDDIELIYPLGKLTA